PPRRGRVGTQAPTCEPNHETTRHTERSFTPMVTTNQTTKVVTGKVRLSYVHLFEPFSNIEGQEPKYSVVLLVPKTDKKTVNAIKKAPQAALEQGKDRLCGGKIPKAWKNTFRDGDEEGDLEKNPEFEGHYFMTVSSKTKPGVVDQSL